MKNIDLKLGKCNENITPFGGLILFRSFLKRLGVSEIIDRNFPRGGSNRSISASLKIIPIILSMICGGRGISDVEKIGSDKVICEMLGLDRVPDISTISRFCNRYGKEEEAIGFLVSIVTKINPFFSRKLTHP
ncbi:hypothetical protein JCM13304A_24360 [Desulfothermus okinawensis JCM 13304]